MGSADRITGSIISKLAADGHLGMTALLRITLASPGLSCFIPSGTPTKGKNNNNNNIYFN